MGNINQDYIEDYIRELLPKENGIMFKMREYAKENMVPIIHPEVNQFIKVLIKSHDINSILEVGTAIGYSAISFCESMQEPARVVTMEINQDMISIAKENLYKFGYSDNVKIIHGDASEEIQRLEDKFDCIFLDGAKGHYVHLLPQCLRLLKNGGLLISDNVLFRGMIASNDLVKRRKITIVKRMRNYLETISKHPSLETSILPLGDGLAISYKKENE